VPLPSREEKLVRKKKFGKLSPCHRLVEISRLRRGGPHPTRPLHRLRHSVHIRRDGSKLAQTVAERTARRDMLKHRCSGVVYLVRLAPNERLHTSDLANHSACVSEESLVWAGFVLLARSSWEDEVPRVHRTPTYCPLILESASR